MKLRKTIIKGHMRFWYYNINPGDIGLRVLTFVDDNVKDSIVDDQKVFWQWLSLTSTGFRKTPEWQPDHDFKAKVGICDHIGLEGQRDRLHSYSWPVISHYKWPQFQLNNVDLVLRDAVEPRNVKSEADHEIKKNDYKRAHEILIL